MSDFSLTLVLRLTTSKIINDMAKVQIKSEKITPFGGIFHVRVLSLRQVLPLLAMPPSFWRARALFRVREQVSRPDLQAMRSPSRVMVSLPFRAQPTAQPSVQEMVVPVVRLLSRRMLSAFSQRRAFMPYTASARDPAIALLAMCSSAVSLVPSAMINTSILRHMSEHGIS